MFFRRYTRAAHRCFFQATTTGTNSSCARMVTSSSSLRVRGRSRSEAGCDTSAAVCSMDRELTQKDGSYRNNRRANRYKIRPDRSALAKFILSHFGDKLNENRQGIFAEGLYI